MLGMEPESARLAVALESDVTRLISAATVVETGIVVESRYGPAGGRELDLLIAKAGYRSKRLLRSRLTWLARPGVAMERASTLPDSIFGDCFSYALAKVTGEPLLFKGDDFTHTDIVATPY